MSIRSISSICQPLYADSPKGVKEQQEFPHRPYKFSLHSALRLAFAQNWGRTRSRVITAHSRASGESLRRLLGCGLFGVPLYGNRRL